MRTQAVSLLMLLFSLSTVQVYSYQALPNSVIPLRIGDTIPDVILENMVNYAGGKARISDFRGKLIILDFWNRGCSACIAGFPRMQELQDKFKNKIQVLLVTNDKIEDFDFIYKKSVYVRNTRLPIVIQDSMLNYMLPHIGVPYHVWIDQNAVVIATSSSNNTTSENINKFLATNTVDFPMRSDFFDYEWGAKSILEDNRFRKGILYSSVITTKPLGFDGSESGLLWDTLLKKSKGKFVINSGMLSLYGQAFGVNLNRIILEDNNNSQKYYPPKDKNLLDAWRLKNNFCYEIKMEDASKENVKKIMQEDISRFFGFKATVENRLTDCYVLTLATSQAQLKLSNKEFTYVKTDDSTLISNIPLDGLINLLNIEFSGEHSKLFINEANFSGSIDLALKAKLYDLPALKRELHKYGIILKEGRRPIQMLVLRDKEPKKRYTINGNITGLKDGTTLYLIHNKNEKPDTVAKTIVKDERFSFQGNANEEAEFYFIKIDTSKFRYSISTKEYIRIMIENTEINLQGTIEDWPYIAITGSASHADYDAFTALSTKAHKRIDKMDSLIRDAIRDKDTIARRKYFIQRQDEYIAFFKTWKDWAINHPASGYTPLIILQLAWDDLAEKQATFNKLTSNALSSHYGRQLAEEMKALNNTAIGRKMPSFDYTPLLNDFSMQDVLKKSKLTLIDFWASWCVPCRAAFPELASLYNKYHNFGLDIVGVSIDTNEKAWRKALEEEKLPWHQLMEKNRSASTAYNIQAIPLTYLVDEKGVIVAKGLYEKELEKKIAEILK